MKGLIPAAGMGTRLKPLTLAIPKELLMVGDKAVIEHVIEAFKKVDITDIVIIVGWRKHAILDYFGSGKSRAVGGVLVIIGLLVGAVFLWCAWLLPFLGDPPIGLWGCIPEGIAAVIGALVGAGIALGVFLLAIMKA